MRVTAGRGLRVSVAAAAVVALGVAAAIVGLAGAAGSSEPGGPAVGGHRAGPVPSVVVSTALRQTAGDARLSRFARPAAASSTWCGSATRQDLVPNVTAGYAVHWIYATPSDGADRFADVASAMQTDAELIDTWWRGQDPTRTPRDDLATFPCGTQLDLSSIRLTASGAELDNLSRFGEIVDAVGAAGFTSSFVKYVVYYDGPVSDADLCGQGGSDTTGFGVAVVYLRSCAGISPSVVAAHELLHTLGAVPAGAPHDCPPPQDGHACDSESDIMYPFVRPGPLSSEILDAGRDDYYGHPGSWLDVQDSHWLVQLDRQVAFPLALSGPGSVSSDVPGLLCSRSCTTTWNAGTQLNLTATPAAGAKLVRWTGGCSGSARCSVTVGQGPPVSALFAPARYRLTVSRVGRGSVRSARPGISCAPRCSGAFSSYVPLRITATPAKGWRFRSWRGACRGAGARASCVLAMSGNASAQAVFTKR